MAGSPNNSEAQPLEITPAFSRFFPEASVSRPWRSTATPLKDLAPSEGVRSFLLIFTNVLFNAVSPSHLEPPREALLTAGEETLRRKQQVQEEQVHLCLQTPAVNQPVNFPLTC